MDPESQPHPTGTAGPAATESTPLLPRPASDDASPPRPVPRWVRISHWAAAVDGLIIAALCFTIVIIEEYYRPRMYSLPWGVKEWVMPNIFFGLISTAWAASSLVRIWRMGELMPPLVASLVHAFLGGMLLVTFTNGAVEVLHDRQRCRWYGPVDPIREHECDVWAAKFVVLLWVYLGAVFVLGVVHAALFVFTCAGPFRGIAWRESLRSWKFPTGQFTVEFTVKFLRQDRDLPPPAPAQSASGASAAEAS
ncbi:hypothetical protein QBC34DRAFT_202048 [Podospora aff. communis PSN243]|uniref:MARVEL domain-containing protein n=1 Tax=Podospora aff. communis PSN243 TaxID=3040156 RepID=A0AAV9G4Y6_9PEZI|nr:hypothetical protein QBC34DRAFT_202048 [Podospora aff. communis PSN243]